ILTLVINRRWGTFTAALSAAVWAFLQNVDNPLINMAHAGVWAWDAFMRFLLIEFVVLLLERVRVEIKSRKPSND
ncbi:MAG: hypothetical protein ACREFR_08585, partial [Limisphaerales bacterium]